MNPQLLDILRVDNPWLDAPGRRPTRTPVGFIPRAAMADLKLGLTARDRVPRVELLQSPGELDRALTPDGLL